MVFANRYVEDTFTPLLLSFQTERSVIFFFFANSKPRVFFRFTTQQRVRAQRSLFVNGNASQEETGSVQLVTTIVAVTATCEDHQMKSSWCAALLATVAGVWKKGTQWNCTAVLCRKPEAYRLTGWVFSATSGRGMHCTVQKWQPPEQNTTRMFGKWAVQSSGKSARHVSNE